MGLKDLFFGKQEQYTAEEKKLILVLMALRISRGMEAEGYSENDAQAMTTDLLKKQDFSGEKILHAPDAMVVKIVKDYIKNLSANLNAAKAQNINIDLDRGKKLTIQHIDKHRNRILALPDSAYVPDNLDDFIFYRVQREVEAVSRDNPEKLGFSRDTVQMMTNVVKAVYQPTINFQI